MATRAALRARVATRVPRSTEENFAGTVNDAFDEFLQWAGKLFVFRDMQKSQSVNFTAGSYRASLSSLTGPTGFDAKPYNIMSLTAGLTNASQRRYPITLRPFSWLEDRFPDRSRTGAIRQRPVFAARNTIYLEIQSPASDAYTLYFVASHLPSRFASDSTVNPISDLDDALVSYGVFAVYSALGQNEDAAIAHQRAIGLFQTAVATATKDSATLFMADLSDPRSCTPYGYPFDLSDLQETYPGDVI